MSGIDRLLRYVEPSGPRELTIPERATCSTCAGEIDIERQGVAIHYYHVGCSIPMRLPGGTAGPCQNCGLPVRAGKRARRYCHRAACRRDRLMKAKRRQRVRDKAASR